MGLVRRFLTAGLTAACLASPAFATTAAQLAETLKLDEVVALLHEEGLEYAGNIEEEMLPGGGGGLWDKTVVRLYNQSTMRGVLETALADEMTTAQIAEADAFFASDEGQAILTYENAARAALSDPAVEEIARATYEDLLDTGDDRLALVTRFVEANDLVERNVAGALSSNYQFFRGLTDGGAFVMSEDDMISDVYSQEAEIRTDTTEWMYGYLLMAYQPLSDDTMQAYIDFSKTDGGRALNAALFEGFDRMYRDISYGLGLAAAQAMTSSDL